MKILKSGSGYTVIELLIVTAVTAVIAVSAFTLVGGQQQKNEYAQAVRDLENSLSDLSNDVARGYFPNATAQQGCEATNLGLDFSGTSQGQGTNSQCIFAGRTVRFVRGSSNFNVQTLAIRKTQRSTNTPVTSLNQLISGDIRAVPNADQTLRALYGMQVQSVRSGGVTSNNATFAFMTSFGGLSSSLTPTGGPVARVLQVTGPDFHPPSYQELPSDGVTVCFEHGSGGRKASVTFGGAGRQLAFLTELDTSKCD